MQRYTPGAIIRHKRTGQSLFVIHVYRTCTIVTDLSEKHLPIPRVLFERDYSDWVDDVDMTATEVTTDPHRPDVTFHYNPLNP